MKGAYKAFSSKGRTEKSPGIIDGQSEPGDLRPTLR